MLLSLLFPALAHAQIVNQYTTTTSGAITDVNCGTAAQISRTFTVPTSYTVSDVNLGIFLSHTYRSDLRITLRSPAGTTVTVMTWTGNVQSGDNMNDLFDDEAAASIATHNAAVTDPLTPAPPPYSHSYQPNFSLSAFDGQNAAGNWLLVVCDAVGGDVGTFTRADLYISQTKLAVTKTSTLISDGVNVTNPKIIPGATIRYCMLVTNPSAAGTVPATAVSVSDPLPANMTFVPGSMRSGTSCAGATTVEDDNAIGTDETDPFGMSISGTTITGTATSLALGSSFALVFDALVN